MAFQLDSSLNITTLATALVSIVLASLVWWRRFVRLASIRVRIASILSLSEEIPGALSAQEVAALITRRLSEFLEPCTAYVYTINTSGDDLEPATGNPKVTSCARDCFVKAKQSVSNNSLCLPMFAQGKLAGVLELQGLENTHLQADEIAALQHMANQAAISLQLLDQRRLRDQILRSEKLGAAGQLISTIAAEFRPSLVRIASAARDNHLDALSAEAVAALDTLDRLISFGRPEQARVQPFDLNLVVRQLADFRQRSWRMQMVTPDISLSTDSLVVLGARGLIEQALLSLLVHAEQALENSTNKLLEISPQHRGGRVVMTIAFAGSNSTADDYFSGLAVARSLIESQGGEFSHAVRDGRVRLDISFPLTSGPAASAASPSGSRSSRRFTLLLAHPHPETLHPLITILGEREHRAVPVDSAGQALDFASRVRFDAVFAASNLADLDWPGLAERAREYVLAVGLLSNAMEAAAPGVPTIHLPVDEAALDIVLDSLDDLRTRDQD